MEIAASDHAPNALSKSDEGLVGGGHCQAVVVVGTVMPDSRSAESQRATPKPG